MTDAPAPSAPRRPRRRFQLRHAGYLALLAVVVVCIVVLTHVDTSTGGAGAGNGAIQRLIPTPGSKILQQDTVGIDLATGYDASLAINGAVIPLDQLTKVDALGQVTFKPGPGKDIETFPAGQNCIVATYWKIADGPNQSTSRSWCFTVV